MRLFNKIVFFAIILLLSMDSFANAGNFYVRPDGGSYGLEDGSDWTNAYNGFSGISWSSVSCGDTIWVAGGTYTQTLSPQKNCTSGSQLYIRRARSDATECTSASGWDASFASTVTQTGVPAISFNGAYDYITVSGRTTSTGGGFGWHIDFTGKTVGPGIDWPAGSTASYITVEYMDIEGPGYITYTNGGRGVDDTPFSSASHHTFSHIKIHDWDSAFYVAGMDYPILEYIEMYNIWAVNYSSYHPDGVYIDSCDNGIVRYSKFYKDSYGCGEGIFFNSTTTGWKIYGNIFYDMVDTGTKAMNIKYDATDLLVYNNTFSNNLVNRYNSGVCAESKNNLVYGSGGDVSCTANSNNLSITSPSPFVDVANKNFHLAAGSTPIDAGTTLTEDGYINYDMDGEVRGQGSTWDVGAYEYVNLNRFLGTTISGGTIQ